MISVLLSIRGHVRSYGKCIVGGLTTDLDPAPKACKMIGGGEMTGTQHCSRGVCYGLME